jgi:hypothetical protein
MKNATATSHGSRRFLEADGAGGNDGVVMVLARTYRIRVA